VQASLFCIISITFPADFGLRLWIDAGSSGFEVLYENSQALPFFNQSPPMIDFTLPADGTYFIEVFDERSQIPFPSSPTQYEMEVWRRTP
jgi:hypothetical protein